MSDFTYEAVLTAFNEMEHKKPCPLCLRIGPRPDENVPNIKVFLFTSKGDTPLKCDSCIDHKETFCNVGHKYRGFERRRVSFSVTSANKNVVFGAHGAESWNVTDLLLEPPDIKRGEDYFLRRLNKIVKPSGGSCSGENDNLIYKGEVPIDVGTKRLELSIEVSIS